MVEHDFNIGAFLQLALFQGIPHLACIVTTSGQAFALAQQIKPRFFLLDYRIHPTTGFALYNQLYAIASLERLHDINTITDFERYHQEIE